MYPFYGFLSVYQNTHLLISYTVCQCTHFMGFLVFIKIPIYGFPTLFVNVPILWVSYSVYQNTNYTICQCTHFMGFLNPH